jgi:hypothetical protein
MNRKWIVKLTPSAESAYSKAFGDSKDEKTKRAMGVLDGLIDQLKEGHLMTSDHTLRGPLSWIYQAGKDRTRIFYALSHPTVTIFHISHVLGGDGSYSDPYPIFASLVMSGRYDQVFEYLGVRRPPWTAPDLSPPNFQ